MARCMSENQYRYMEFRFDQGRLDRAQDIVVVSVDEGLQHLPEHHYMAVGGESHHYLHTKPHLDCDCRDFSVGFDRLCKHLIAALQYEKDPVFMQAVKGAVTPKKVTIVCGPPAAGKSTYVNENKEDGDIVWDFDVVSQAIGGGDRTIATVDFTKKMRDAFLIELRTQVQQGRLQENVWIAWGLPNRGTRERLSEELNAEVVVIATPAEQCTENEKKRRGELEAVRTERDAKRWWERYTPSPQDLVIS